MTDNTKEAIKKMLVALIRFGCQDKGACPDPVDGLCFCCAAVEAGKNAK